MIISKIIKYCFSHSLQYAERSRHATTLVNNSDDSERKCLAVGALDRTSLAQVGDVSRSTSTTAVTPDSLS